MAKKNEKPKSAKEMKKELEDKMFGMKNKKKSKELKKQLEKIQVSQLIERKKKQEEQSEKVHLFQPKAPIGVDPKTIPCVYYINKLCSKGDKCKYMHEKKVLVQEVHENTDTERSKLVCRFLIDAINEGHLLTNWKCPNNNCKDIHKLTELGDVEITLEEFIELSRQTLPENLIPLTEKSFNEWKEKRNREEELHKKRVQALRQGFSGADLFKEKPEVFVDDDEAADVDYHERNYNEDEEEEEIIKKFENLDIQ